MLSIHELKYKFSIFPQLTSNLQFSHKMKAQVWFANIVERCIAIWEVKVSSPRFNQHLGF